MADTVLCKHCFDPVIHLETVDEQGNVFCCQGCQSVYTILHHQGWEKYYELLKIQNLRAPSVKGKRKYQNQVLDWDKQGVFADWGRWEGDRHQVKLESQGITCSACAWLLETALSKLKGVIYYRVDFVGGTMEVAYHATKISLKKILEECHGLGYEFYPNLSDPSIETVNPLLPRIVIAAGAFMNVMAFAFAEYFGLSEDNSQGLQNYFRIWSFIITLPVVTYSAFPFYQKAWSGLKQKTLHMDLPISMGILLAFGYSTYTLFSHVYTPFFDSLSGIVLFLLVGRWVVNQFERKLALGQNLPEALDKEKGWLSSAGKPYVWTSLHEAEVGDHIMIAENKIVPLDTLLVSDEAVFDTSLLTGEDKPRFIKKGEVVHSGFKNLRGEIVLSVIQNITSSKTQQLLRQLKTIQGAKNYEKFGSEKIVPWFIGFVVILALCGFLFHLDKGLAYSIHITVSLLIITCLCAIALCQPLSVSMMYSQLEKLGFYFVKPQLFFQFSQIKGLVLDKTGTLTYTHKKIKSWDWQEIPQSMTKEDILKGIRHLARTSFHPVSLTLENSLADIELEGLTLLKSREWVGFGLEGVFEVKEVKDPHINDSSTSPKGIKQIYTLGITKYFQNIQEIPEALKNNYENLLTDPRWMALQSSPPSVCILLNGQCVATLKLTEEVKPSAKEWIEYAKSQGIRIALVSGDALVNVEKMANQLEISTVHGNCSPEHKKQIVEDLRRQWGPILAVGDGFNDSLLLGVADHSIAIGQPGVLLNGVDGYFIKQDLSAFTKLFKLSKKLTPTIFLAYTVSVTYNVGAITLAWMGFVAPLVSAILMPISTLSILFVIAWRLRLKPSH